MARAAATRGDSRSAPRSAGAPTATSSVIASAIRSTYGSQITSSTSSESGQRVVHTQPAASPDCRYEGKVRVKSLPKRCRGESQNP